MVIRSRQNLNSKEEKKLHLKKVFKQKNTTLIPNSVLKYLFYKSENQEKKKNSKIDTKNSFTKEKLDCSFRELKNRIN